MKILIGVDWSDEAFATVQQVLYLYRPSEVILVHGIDMGIFEYPALAQAANVQGYEEFRRALTDAGRQVLDRAASLLPAGFDAVKKINEVGKPAHIVLETAQKAEAELVAVGARRHSRLAEIILGSVSHRVLMHASRSTLVVKGAARPVQRVLVAVEGKDDADRIIQWLRLHPFENPVELCVLTVVVPVQLADPYYMAGVESWSTVAMAHAEKLVKDVGAALPSDRYRVSTKALAGEVAATVAEQAEAMDLVVVASHGRQGVDRLLMGSVSHAIVHRVASPVLVIR